MFCSKCGAQIPDDNEFCPKCGAQVIGAAGSTGTIVKNSRKKEPGCTVKFVRYLGRRLIALIRYLAGCLVKFVCYLGGYLIAGALFCVVFGLLHWFEFNRFSHAADLLKKQVEICYLERGSLDRCSDYWSGKGWDLGEAVREAESSFFVSKAEVKNGVITIYPSTFVHRGLPQKRHGVHGAKEKDFKEIFVPYPSFGSSDAALNWTESTCEEHGC